MITSAVAALNWFRSASPPLESLNNPDTSSGDSPLLYTIAGRVEMDNIRRVLQASARFNKNAAIWTGISALLSAATTLVGIAS